MFQLVASSVSSVKGLNGYFTTKHRGPGTGPCSNLHHV